MQCADPIPVTRRDSRDSTAENDSLDQFIHIDPVTSLQLDLVYSPAVTEQSLTGNDILRVLEIMVENRFEERLRSLQTSAYREIYQIWAINAYPTDERIRRTTHAFRNKISEFSADHAFSDHFDRLVNPRPANTEASNNAGANPTDRKFDFIAPHGHTGLQEAMTAVFANDIPKLTKITDGNEALKTIIGFPTIISIKHRDLRALIAHQTLVMMANVLWNFGLHNQRKQFILAIAMPVELTKLEANHSVLSEYAFGLVDFLYHGPGDHISAQSSSTMPTNDHFSLIANPSHPMQENSIIATVFFKIHEKNAEFKYLFYKVCLKVVWSSRSDALNEMLARATAQCVCEREEDMLEMCNMLAQHKIILAILLALEESMPRAHPRILHESSQNLLTPEYRKECLAYTKPFSNIDFEFDFEGTRDIWTNTFVLLGDPNDLRRTALWTAVNLSATLRSDLHLSMGTLTGLFSTDEFPILLSIIGFRKNTLAYKQAENIIGNMHAAIDKRERKEATEDFDLNARHKFGSILYEFSSNLHWQLSGLPDNILNDFEKHPLSAEDNVRKLFGIAAQGGPQMFYGFCKAFMIQFADRYDDELLRTRMYGGAKRLAQLFATQYDQRQNEQKMSLVVHLLAKFKLLLGPSSDPNKYWDDMKSIFDKSHPQGINAPQRFYKPIRKYLAISHEQPQFPQDIGRFLLMRQQQDIGRFLAMPQQQLKSDGKWEPTPSSLEIFAKLDSMQGITDYLFFSPNPRSEVLDDINRKVENLLTVISQNNLTATENIMSNFDNFSHSGPDFNKFYMLYYGMKSLNLKSKKLKKFVKVLSGLAFSNDTHRSQNIQVLAKLIYDVGKLDYYWNIVVPDHVETEDPTEDKEFIAGAIDVISQVGNPNIVNLLSHYMVVIFACRSKTDWSQKFPVGALLGATPRDRVKIFLEFVICSRRNQPEFEWIATRTTNCIFTRSTSREERIEFIASLAYEISIATADVDISQSNVGENGIVTYIEDAYHSISKPGQRANVTQAEYVMQFFPHADRRKAA